MNKFKKYRNLSLLLLLPGAIYIAVHSLMIIAFVWFASESFFEMLFGIFILPILMLIFFPGILAIIVKILFVLGIISLIYFHLRYKKEKKLLEKV